MYIDNFSYLIKTDIEEFYYKLLQAQSISFENRKIAEMILRSVVEGVLRKKAKKEDIEYEGGIALIISSLRMDPGVSFPVRIQNYIDIARGKEKKEYSLQDMMIIVNAILMWYLDSDKSYTFTPGKSIEDEKDYILSLRNDIFLKENEIQALRARIMQQQQSANIINLNNIIIKIKNAKQESEEKLKKHQKYFYEYKKQYGYIIPKMESYIKSYDQNNEKQHVIKTHITNIESKLVNAEIAMKEMNDYIDNLESRDNRLTERVYFAKENMGLIRKNYKILKFISRNLEDCLESYCFADNCDIKKKINDKIEDLNYSFKTNLSKLNNSLDEYMIVSKDLKKSASVFKNIVNDNIIHKIRYKEFFRSFTNLDEKRIKMLYILISSYIPSIGIKNIISRPQIDDIYFYIKNEMDRLKNINKDEIHLLLYYKILKLSNVLIFNITNRYNFINSLDSIVDTSLQIFAEDIKSDIIYDKIQSLKSFYIGLCISFFKEQTKDIFIKFSDEDIDDINSDIESLDNKILSSIYRNAGIMDNYSDNLKKILKTDIFKVIDILSKYDDEKTYLISIGILYRLCRIIGSSYNIVSYSRCTSAEEFMSLQFVATMLVLENKKNVKRSISNTSCCVPLIVLSIVMADVFREESSVTFDGYNRLISIWNAKKELYTSLKDSVKKKNRQLYHYELTSLKNLKTEKEKEKLVKEIKVMEKKLNLIRTAYTDIDNSI